MTWLQRITYVFLNNLARVALRIYFKKITILNKRNLPKDAATIIAPNHPNTMVDPILMATIAPGWIHFLANYGLFKHPVTKFLMTKVFFSIPVKRPKDVAPGEPINNLATIKQCSQVLGDGGTIFMGPEATSYSYRRIRPMKDGIARIALTAARRKKFNSGLVIMPLGTNYSKPYQFRSEIILKAGRPIQIDQYKDVYKKNKDLATQKIMKELRGQLESLTIHTQNEEENQILVWSEELARTENKINTLEEQLEYDRKTLPVLRSWRQNDVSDYENHWQKCHTYFNQIEQENTTDQALMSIHEKEGKIRKPFILYLLWPFYIIGCILNIVWFVPQKIFNALKLYKAYTGMVNILTGIVLIPLFYSMVFTVVGISFGIKYLILFMLMTLITGLTILPYQSYLREWKEKINASAIRDKEKLISLRNDIIGKLETKTLL